MWPLIWILLGTSILVLVLHYIFFWNAPLRLSEEYVGTIFFVHKHENNIAHMLPSYSVRPIENDWMKFIIPESFGRLEPGKTYELKKENGEIFITQVAIMMD